MISIKIICFQQLEPVTFRRPEIEHKYDVGDLVKWKSCGTVKEGEIMAVVPPGYYPPVFEFEDLPDFSSKSFSGGAPRKSVSYLIALIPKGRCRVRRLYWPHVEHLNRIK